MVVVLLTGPYPSAAANFLKLFADLQIFVVAAVGLVLRVDDSRLEKEGWTRAGQFNRAFYGNLMLGFLLMTLFFAVVAMVYKTPMERALSVLQKKAKELAKNVDLNNLPPVQSAKLELDSEGGDATEPDNSAVLATTNAADSEVRGASKARPLLGDVERDGADQTSPLISSSAATTAAGASPTKGSSIDAQTRLLAVSHFAVTRRDNLLAII